MGQLGGAVCCGLRVAGTPEPKSLKPGGRIVFVEFRAEDPNVPIKAVHKMSEEQVRKEMKAQLLDWVETSEVLPWQHIIVFRKKAAG